MQDQDTGFNLTPEDYDALIDWPRRLANEAPFYRRIFDEVGVERVLDAACGTGRHAAMFRDWGLSAEGADNDARMVEFCRRTHGESDRLRWQRRSFADPYPEPGAFDAVICVGNSLSLTDENASLDGAVGAMLESLRPGGVCVIQVLNIWRFPDGPTEWRTIKLLPHDDGQRLLLKGIHRSGAAAHVDLLDLRLAGGEVERRLHSVSFRGIRECDMAAAVQAAGGVDCRFHGSQQFEPYAAAASPDLIAVYKRA